MAIQTETAWVMRCRLKQTGQYETDSEGRIKYYVSPFDFVLTAGFVLTREIANRDGWRAYDYDNDPPIGYSCDIPGGTPETGAPVWLPETSNTPGQQTFNIIAPVAGVAYSQVIPFSAIIAAEGETITDISLEPHPYLILQYDSPTSRKITGNVPVGITEMSVALTAKQSDNKTARKVFTKTAITQTVRLYASYNKNTQTLSLFVGPYGAVGNPIVSLYDCPIYYNDKASYNAGSIRTVILPTGTGKEYSYFLPYERIVTGDYVPKVEWLNQTLYGAFTLQEETDFVQEVALSPNAPELQGDMGPDFDGLQEEAVPVECTQNAKLTEGEFNSLPKITVFEYKNGSEQTRAFVSRDEALSVIPTHGQTGSFSRFDLNSCTSSTAEVGAILYNDNRPDSPEYPDAERFYRAVEAGWWGWNRVSATDFYVLQTDACGNIITKEHITT